MAGSVVAVMDLVVVAMEEAGVEKVVTSSVVAVMAKEVAD